MFFVYQTKRFKLITHQRWHEVLSCSCPLTIYTLQLQLSVCICIDAPMEEELGSNHGEDTASRLTDNTDTGSLARTDIAAPDGSMLSPTISESLMNSADWPQPGGDGSMPPDAGPLPEGLVAGLLDPAKAKKRTRKPAPLGKLHS